MGDATAPATPPSGGVERVLVFLERQPWITDALFVAMPLSLLSYASRDAFYGHNLFLPGWVELVLSLAMTGVLALRRTLLVPAAVTVAAAALLMVVLLIPPSIQILAVPITVYTVARFGSPKVSRTFLGIGLAGSLLVLVPYSANVFGIGLPAAGRAEAPALGFQEAVLATVVAGFCASTVMVAWMLGEVGARSRRRVAEIEERNRLLIRERAREAAAAATDERLRIARDMHDVVSHSLSVMIAQADGGRYIASSDPHAAERALGTIASTGRESLVDLRRMLGVLRSSEDPVEHRPQPKATDIAELVGSVRAAGLPVEHRQPEWLDELPEGQSLAVYRVVQEALTNTLKHAGPDARARVLITTAGPDLLVEIVDHDPSGSRVAPSASIGGGEQRSQARPGSGIEGMKERVALFSGTVEAGVEGAGFAVRARFPASRELPAADPTRIPRTGRSAVPTSTDSLTWDARR
ncbi:sensor histidine kinase [Dietzia sp. PP-33]|jgi:signal transduction histidine kinase|uniref:sensor histidine kinase n=1 Tax=Dietzia sp. PP-33 TaxID=2957500 RepID=UPI00299FF52D|nr:histidine kinase [Dietzia sp. PP-33]MDX2356732.1 histidine kinase [Dietzia sp. PP-33]